MLCTVGQPKLSAFGYVLSTNLKTYAFNFWSWPPGSWWWLTYFWEKVRKIFSETPSVVFFDEILTNNHANYNILLYSSVLNFIFVFLTSWMTFIKTYYIFTWLTILNVWSKVWSSDNYQISVNFLSQMNV
jgi:hypothetical protein